MTQRIEFPRAARINGQAAPGALSVHRGKLRPFRRNLIFRENGFDRAFWHTCITINARLRVDHEHVVIDMKCIDGAHYCTIRVASVDAGFGDHVGHKRIILQV